MWHVVPGMKSTLNEITMVQVPYARCAGRFSLMGSGWVPGDVVVSALIPYEVVFAIENPLIRMASCERKPAG